MRQWQVELVASVATVVDAGDANVLPSGVLVLMNGMAPVAVFAAGSWVSARQLDQAAKTQ